MVTCLVVDFLGLVRVFKIPQIYPKLSQKNKFGENNSKNKLRKA